MEPQRRIYTKQEKGYEQEGLPQEGTRMSSYDYVPCFERGDLVEVGFGPGQDRATGIFMHYEKWADDLRALVFWDGEPISTPVVQLTLIERAK